MSPFHRKVLLRIPGANVTAGVDSTVLGETGAALCAKLKRAAWPFVGVRCLTITLADGTRYTPSIVTVDEGVAVAWEPADGPQRMPAAHLLPALSDPTVHFVTVDRMSHKVWIEHEPLARRDVPQEFIDARATLEKMRGRPVTVTDWDVRDWYAASMRAMKRRVARVSEVSMATAAG